MALLEVRYDGISMGSITIRVDPRGHYIKAVISGAGSPTDQVGHVWKHTIRDGAVGRASAERNSNADKLLEVLIIPDSDTEFQYTDFITLEHVLLEWLFLEE
jgi:hypothetical protein